jgi:hypothetical protein
MVKSICNSIRSIGYKSWLTAPCSKKKRKRKKSIIGPSTKLPSKILMKFFKCYVNTNHFITNAWPLGFFGHPFWLTWGGRTIPVSMALGVVRPPQNDEMGPGAA